MGLDMYLFRADKETKLNRTEEECYDENGSYIDDPVWDSEELAYWRKANHIHGWFVEHVQDGTDDCGSYEVTKEKILELRRTCYDILSGKGDPEFDLPYTSGFFFGARDGYDMYYYMSISQTIATIDDIIPKIDFETERIVYAASW